MRGCRIRISLGMALATLALVAGCGSSQSSVEQVFRGGIAEIQRAQPADELQGRLTETLGKLRQTGASSSDDGRAKALAISGFTWTLNGLQARRDMAAKDSGRLEAAVRDAKRADRNLSRGAKLLRAAGRALGAPVGELNGY